MKTVLIEPNGKFKSSGGWKDLNRIKTLSVSKLDWENTKNNSLDYLHVTIIEMHKKHDTIHHYDGSYYNRRYKGTGEKISVFKKAFKLINETNEIENFFEF